MNRKSLLPMLRWYATSLWKISDAKGRLFSKADLFIIMKTY